MKHIILSIVSVVLISAPALQANFFTNFCKEQVTALKTTGFRREAAGLGLAAGLCGVFSLHQINEARKWRTRMAIPTPNARIEQDKEGIRKNVRAAKIKKCVIQALVGFGAAGICAYGAWKLSEKQ